MAGKNRVKSVHHCPVAIALRRVFSLSSEQVMVMPSYLFINGLKIETPEQVTKFINDYEQDLLIRAFDFELPVPPEGTYYKGD